MAAAVLMAAPLILLAHWAAQQSCRGGQPLSWCPDTADSGAAWLDAQTVLRLWQTIKNGDNQHGDSDYGVTQYEVAVCDSSILEPDGVVVFEEPLPVTDRSIEVGDTAEPTLAANGTAQTHVSASTATEEYWSRGSKPGNAVSPTARVLRRQLARMDSLKPELRRRARTVAQFVTATTEQLRAQSALLRNVSVLYAGGAYEGTAADLDADFDTFALVPHALTAQFRIIVDGYGLFQAQLPAQRRDHVLKIFPELRTLLDDGFLNALRFKQWAFDQLRRALRRAARRLPSLGAVLYQTRGACGANLTTADGALLEVDLGVILTVSEPSPGHLRPGSLGTCGAHLRDGGGGASWYLYSEQDITSATEPAPAHHTHKFIGNAQRLEQRLLAHSRTLRDVIRLMKRISHAQNWHARFHLESFVVKQAGFWAFSEHCALFRDDSRRLLPALTATISILSAGLRSGYLPEFFLYPGHNGLRKLADRTDLALRLADQLDTIERWLYVDAEQVFSHQLSDAGKH